MKKIALLLLVQVCIFSFADAQKGKRGPHKRGIHPEWSLQGNIYEVNVRQYTKEGTFNAFAKHLPRLKKMGVEILWFMPITPIGIEGRKQNASELGSYYAVRNYKAVNEEFGTMSDWKKDRKSTV